MIGIGNKKYLTRCKAKPDVAHPVIPLAAC